MEKMGAPHFFQFPRPKKEKTRSKNEEKKVRTSMVTIDVLIQFCLVKVSFHF